MYCIYCHRTMNGTGDVGEICVSCKIQRQTVSGCSRCAELEKQLANLRRQLEEKDAALCIAESKSGWASHFAELRRQLAELERINELHRQREMECIAKWQAENNAPHMQPDYGRLLDWLHEKVDNLDWEVVALHKQVAVRCDDCVYCQHTRALEKQLAEAKNNAELADGCLAMIKDALVRCGEDMSATPPMNYDDAIKKAWAIQVVRAEKAEKQLAERDAQLEKAREALQRIASGMSVDRFGTDSLCREDMQSIAQAALFPEAKPDIEPAIVRLARSAQVKWARENPFTTGINETPAAEPKPQMMRCLAHNILECSKVLTHPQNFDHNCASHGCVPVKEGE